VGQIGIVSGTGVFDDDKASHWASTAATFGAKRTCRDVASTKSIMDDPTATSANFVLMHNTPFTSGCY